MSDQPKCNPRANIERRDAILSIETLEKFNEYLNKQYRDMSYNLALGEDLIDTIRQYIYAGRPVGNFVEAVIANDLSDAVGRADDINIHRLPWIVALIYNIMPMGIRGSRAEYQNWLKIHYRAREEEAAEKDRPSPT